MTVTEKFYSLSIDKQDLVIDQLADRVRKSGDIKFSLMILSNNLGLNGKEIIDRIKLKLS